MQQQAARFVKHFYYFIFILLFYYEHNRAPVRRLSFYVCRGYNVVFKFIWVFMATFIKYICILLAEKLSANYIHEKITD